MNTQGDPKILEQRHVTDVYDLIAAHFSSTRYKAWPRVENFLHGLERGSIVADVGCGNGKYMGINPNTTTIGSDRSGKFAEICAEKGFESMICDNLYLPYRDCCFDSVISIAVVHHFASPERRLQAVKELIRILRKGGQLLFTVWAIQQDWKNKQYGEQDVMIPWHFREDFKKKTEKKTRPGRLKKKEERRDKFQQKSAEDNSNAEAKRDGRRRKEEQEQQEDVSDLLGSALHIDDDQEMITKTKTETDTQIEEITDNKTNTKEVSADPTKGSTKDSTKDPTTDTETTTTTTDKQIDTNSTKEVKANEPQQNDVYHRYYHLFKEGEIEEMFTHLPNVKLLEVVLDHDIFFNVEFKFQNFDF